MPRTATSRPTPPWCWPRPRRQEAARHRRAAAGAPARPIPTWSMARSPGRASSTSSLPIPSGASGCATAWSRASPTAIRRWAAARKVNVEYVSANPTGPLHVAHARGAVVGDALANLLLKAAMPSPRNTTSTMPARRSTSSASRPTCAIARRWAQRSATIPEGLYPGEYLKEVGAAIARRDGARWIDKPEADWLPEMREFAIAALMAEIKADLETLGVHIDVYSSERALRRVGRGRSRLPGARPPGPDLSGPARAAQGPEARRLGGSRADPVPRHPVRRRGRPAAQEVGRQLDLLRQRHRLPPRQVPPRLLRHDRRLGRRPWRLRQAHEGGGQRHHRGQGRARRQALPARARDARTASWCACPSAPAPSSPCATSWTRSGPTSCASPC